MVDACSWKGSKQLRVAFNPVAMAIIVDVTLISGHRVSLEADLTTPVQSLAERAREPLELAVGDSSLRLAACWMEIHSWEQPSCSQAIV